MAAKGFNIEVKITDTSVFKDLLSLTKEIIKDDRIPHPVRQEYFTKLMGLKGAKDGSKDSKGNE